jgi:hypothetical protein
MKNPNGQDCVHCHLEHNGVDFPLIHWEPSRENFDHSQTGYRLEGKHASVPCVQCHVPKNMVPAERALIRYQDASKSFLGLATACSSCHTDPHKGQLGNDCQRCHNVSDWKAANQFDHSETRYPLTGLHQQVKCEQCHKPDGPGRPARYKDMRFAACTDCHLDPHKGSFRTQRCEGCHTTAGWKKLLGGFTFDHSKTQYPLEGGHIRVSCSSCHMNGDFNKKLQFVHCTDCHRDTHKGQFSARPARGECSECHNVAGWKPSLFGVKEHASSRYPLEGKHVSVACAKCHLPAGQDTLYQVKFAACADCHKDVHRGQFSGPPFGDRCEACHVVQDFHRTLFTLAKHRESRFPLTGAHLAVPCNSCHKPAAAHGEDNVLPFRFNDRTCTACHNDPHHGEFRERMARRRSDGSTYGCEACHNTNSWGAVTGFDHSKTAFPLLGVHRAVPCNDCHKPAANRAEIQFKGTTKLCEGCHVDPHGSQFRAKAGGTPCANCHSTDRWTPSTFDHDKRTKFALSGGHASVKCESCHNSLRFIDRKQVLFYKPTPLECSACHGPNFAPKKAGVTHITK